MEKETHIAWREWNAETFAEAASQDKPILLDIGAVWCHWCHVMDSGIPGDPTHPGTYSNPEVQKKIEANFIPIKVDNDRRPDINARYNMGGWPTTAFLTPSGDTLYGETYVPPSRMISLLDHIAEVWRSRKDDVTAQAAAMRTQRAAAEQESPASELDSTTAANVARAVKQHFDPEHGGFGTQPKFPHPDALLFALEQYALTGDDTLRDFAVKTLHGMADGGMYDRFAGGFFRYSTTRDWSIPHFEKMLEGNAKLTRVYAIASQILGDQAYMETVRTAHNWLLTEMRDPATGTFAGSQDADKEEAYYGHPLDIRATMATPFVDRTIYAGWNALMVSSLVARYRITGEQDILAAAIEAFEFLVHQMSEYDAKTVGWSAGDSVAKYTVLRHYYCDGQAQGSVDILTDQTDFIAAALDLYEATGNVYFNWTANEAAEYVLDFLEDRENGGFYDTRLDPTALGELARPKKDMSENSNAALALLRLSLCGFADEARLRTAAQSALQCFAGEYERTSYFAASYARAVAAALRPPLHIVVVGNGDDSRRWELQQAGWKAVAPGKVVETLGVSDAASREFPAGDDGSPRAYVCVGEVCLAPASEPGTLSARIQEALAK